MQKLDAGYFALRNGFREHSDNLPDAMLSKHGAFSQTTQQSNRKSNQQSSMVFDARDQLRDFALAGE